MANPSLHNIFLRLIGISAVLLWAGTAAVAIDSRVTSGGNFRDDMCKLFPLSERVIFFSAGVYNGKDPDGTVIFSPHAAAREVFDLSVSHSTSDIAEQWAHTMLERIKVSSNREIIEHNEDGFITRGVFAGESNNEGFVAYQSSIRRSYNGETMDLGYTNERIPQGYFLGLGHTEVVEPNLHNGPDEWAKQIHDQIVAKTAGITGHPEEAAIWVSTVTQAVIGRAGDRRIGGQVASIILERGHDWRWFRRPDFCPEH